MAACHLAAPGLHKSRAQCPQHCKLPTAGSKWRGLQGRRWGRNGIALAGRCLTRWALTREARAAGPAGAAHTHSVPPKRQLRQAPAATHPQAAGSCAAPLPEPRTDAQGVDEQQVTPQQQLAHAQRQPPPVGGQPARAAALRALCRLPCLGLGGMAGVPRGGGDHGAVPARGGGKAACCCLGGCRNQARLRAQDYGPIIHTVQFRH